jgi:hypothetical protein
MNMVTVTVSSHLAEVDLVLAWQLTWSQQWQTQAFPCL